MGAGNKQPLMLSNYHAACLVQPAALCAPNPIASGANRKSLQEPWSLLQRSKGEGELVVMCLRMSGRLSWSECIRGNFKEGGVISEALHLPRGLSQFHTHMPSQTADAPCS